MRSIVYTSVQTYPLSDGELAAILAVGREKNTAVGVTGILAHRDDNCLGILEGDDEAVRARFEQVSRHPGHKNVRLLCDDPITVRAFPDWSMAFQPIDPLMREVPGFIDLFDAARPADREFGQSRARALLEWFRSHPLAPVTSQPDTEGDVLRRRTVNGAIAVLHDVGPERCTLDAVARRSELSVEDIQSLFPTRQSLIVAAVERWSSAVSAPLLPLAAERGAVAYLHALTVAYAEEPALMRLLASVLAFSADRNAEGADTIRRLYQDFNDTIRSALTADIRAGREPATMDPTRGAQQLIALYDGLRIQSLLTDGLDIVDAFDRASTRMRRGWAEAYERPDFWEIGTVYDLST